MYGWYMVPTDAHMVDMQMLLRTGAATPAVNRRTGRRPGHVLVYMQSAVHCT